MGDQRQFRFRLPWLSAATAPRPALESPAPRATSEPTQPTIIGVPFRPPGFAQIQMPPPPQGRPESLPSSPTRAPWQTRPGSVPSSPVLSASQPPSPVRAPTRPRPPVLGQLPIRATTQPTTTASLPPSPTRASQPPSPARATIKPGPVAVSESSILTRPQPGTKSVPSSPVRDVSQPQPTAQTTTLRRPFELITQRERKVALQPEKPAAEVKPITSPPSAPKGIQPEVEKQPLPPPFSAPQPKEETKPQFLAKEQTQPAIRPEVEERPLPSSLFGSQPTSIDSKEEPKPQPAKEPQGVSESILRELEKQDTPTFEEPAITQKMGNLLGRGTKDAKKFKERFDREEKLNHTAAQEPKEAEKMQQKWQGDFEIPSKTPSAANGEHIKMVSIRPPGARTPPENHQKPAVSNGERVAPHKEIREDIFRLIRKLGSGQAKSLADEYPVSVVTLAGDNKGASMHLGTESLKKDGFLNIHREYKAIPDDTIEAKSDTEETSTDKKPNHLSTKEDAESKAYINSNTQSLNNSIMFHSSVKENDPGVKLNLSQSPEMTSKSGIITEPFDTKRAKFSATPSEKLTYEPTIRRRCLRGLMMESSDSDDNGKPRKHGCRYNCGAKFVKDDDEIDEM